MADKKDDLYLKQKADPERKLRLMEDRQDKALEDIRKREKTSVIKDNSLSTKDKWVVKGGTDHINTKEAQKVLNSSEYLDKIATKRAANSMAKKIASRGLKALPVIGTVAGLASAAESAYAGDYDTAKDELASAADPTGISDAMLIARDIAESKLDSDTEVGMKNAELQGVESYKNSPAAMDAKKEALRRVRGY
jgi:hypothetical protein